MDTDANNPDDPGTSRARPIVAVKITTEKAKAPKKTADQRLAARVAKAKANLASKAADPPPPVQLNLPYFWPDDKRGAPNLLLRNALFSATDDREFFPGRKLAVLASAPGHTIKASARLNQYDLDNLELILHLRRGQPLAKEVPFEAYAFLKALRRPTNGSASFAQLHECMHYLSSTIVEIRAGDVLVHDSLFGFVQDMATNRYVVTLRPWMLELFDRGYTQVDFEQRMALGRNNLAKWLQIFVASSPPGSIAPYPVAELRRLSGSKAKRLSNFYPQLRKAMGELVKVGMLAQASRIDDEGMVHFIRARAPVKRLPKN